MSLYELLGSAAESLLSDCPTEPQLYHRAAGSELDETITLRLMDCHIDHGLLNPTFTAAVKDGRAVHPGRFSKDGQMKPGKLRALFNDGHTVNLRELQRTVPYLAEVCRAIQDETGYSLYVSAIITPPGRQGLRHHWDQFIAVVTQMHGHKRWPIWRPEVDLPVDDYLDSPVMWTQEMQDRWDTTEPYAVYDLGPGDTLVLPRGWVHSPHCVKNETSFHLTFALRERTVLDLARELVVTALPQRDFRAGIAPRDLHGDALVGTLRNVRKTLISYLDQVDLSATAETVKTTLLP
ncbi:JmjC domain-containing protein [Kitasatospora aureofaciens]|uniref:JmjC domain-containing protein n=1 Tax=Kitasatospora aureofaciens TaxID=1894 RepID=UPI000525A941|nr:cupin domain-containing protein [Kitasatospora aureofaciens]